MRSAWLKCRRKKLVVLLNLHGDAFVIESPFSKAVVMVVSVNYLVPEHLLPRRGGQHWCRERLPPNSTGAARACSNRSP